MGGGIKGLQEVYIPKTNDILFDINIQLEMEKSSGYPIRISLTIK